MNERIAELREQLVADPDSMAFLELGMLLLQEKELAAGEVVARRGVERHPDSADARDLHARALLMLDRLQESYLEWEKAVALQPRNISVRKGLGFLCFRGGDYDAALEHLEIALSIDPFDKGVIQGIQKVRKAIEEEEHIASRGAALGEDTVLVDDKGQVIAGTVLTAGKDVSEQVAAFVGGVAKEAERTARMVGLGDWVSLIAETNDGNLCVTVPVKGANLVLKRPAQVRPAQLQILAESAGESARELWDRRP